VVTMLAFLESYTNEHGDLIVKSIILLWAAIQIVRSDCIISQRYGPLIPTWWVAIHLNSIEGLTNQIVIENSKYKDLTNGVILR
jgi:hypothetical protein